MLSHRKAYLLGLLVGGGKLDQDTFLIELPFKKWGMDPERMNKIAVDILQRISDIFFKEYSLRVTYEIGNSKWYIKQVGEGDFEQIIVDLSKLGLPTTGPLLNKASLSVCKGLLRGISAENFLSGIFDARASITLSHRRFNNTAPVVSIEIPGSTKNFAFVVQMCSWLTELGSTTDQILYNHPNQHSPSDPYYMGWKKGFKIRFLVRSFLANHSFALKAKSIDAKWIEQNQTKEEQPPCLQRKIRKPSPVSVHDDINSSELPVEVRNKLYFHYFHFCASLGCKFAPQKEVSKLISNIEEYISFFPRLAKGSFEEVFEKFDSIHKYYFESLDLLVEDYSIETVLDDSSQFVSYYGLEQGLAFLLAKELNGKRHKGPMNKILDQNTKKIVSVYSFNRKKNEPILILNPQNMRAILCSSLQSYMNRLLIKKYTKISGINVELR